MASSKKTSNAPSKAAAVKKTVSARKPAAAKTAPAKQVAKTTPAKKVIKKVTQK